VLRVQYIFFNDPAVTGVKPWQGHDDHMHVRFYEP
jgi:murein endopeptidase